MSIYCGRQLVGPRGHSVRAGRPRFPLGHRGIRNGLRVPDAPVQAKDKETGAIVRTVSAADGGYAFADIPAAVYELSIAMPCCAFDPFESDVTVRAGQATPFDVRLVETVGGQTLGDDPGRIAEMIRRRSKVPSLLLLELRALAPRGERKRIGGGSR